MRDRKRFSRWVDEGHNDAKEWFLSLVGGSWHTDDEALSILNGKLATAHTLQSVRSWIGSDPEFAEALKVARHHREQGREYRAQQRQLPDSSLPPRPGSVDPHASFADDGRRGIGQRLRDWGRALVMAEPEQTEQPTGHRFIAIEEMTDQHAAEARRQMRERERPALATPQGVFRSSGDPASMPEPEPDPHTGWRPSVFGAPSSESFPEPNR